MKKHGKKSLLEIPLKPLKIVRADTQLPGVFDTLWDAKVGEHLELIRDRKTRLQVRHMLAKNGFDANEWFDRTRSVEKIKGYEDYD